MTRADRMLWFKAWTETRLYFLPAMVLLIAMVGSLALAFPGSPDEEFPNGALAVPAAQVRALPHDARTYMWLHWFANNLVLWLPMLALALASTGFPPRIAATGALLHTLTLPVSRRRMAGIRVSMGLVQIAAAAVVPSLLVPIVASLRGQSYAIGESLAHACLAIAGAASLYALFVLFSVTLGELGKAVAGAAVLLLYGMFTFLVEEVRRYSVLRLMTGDMYFLRGEIPWLGVGASVCAALLLLAGSLKIVERRDY